MPLIDSSNSNSNTENCRTCVDFKTWTKTQRKSLSTSEVNSHKHYEIKVLLRNIIFFRKRM